ncbi:hypothetical protein RhiirB3_455396 [Rhizophagus irregularis]|nr:hypothetical protein RhiirB3_455396 [Rhizophagus irregularis]
MLSTSNNTPCNKFECRICGKIYKRNSGLTRHMATIKDANSEKLKQHSRHVESYQCQESDPLQEPDPLQHHTLINTTEKARKQRTRKPRPVQIIIGWKRKSKSDKYSI